MDRLQTLRRCRRATGFTMVEMLLALAGTALIATTVSGMLFAVAHGASSGTDLRNLVPKQRVPAQRLGAALRGTLQVMEVEADGLVLWYEDLNHDAAASSDELLWLSYDPATGNLNSVKAAAGISGAAVTPASDFDALRAALSAAGNLEEQAWAKGLTGLEFTADVAVPNTRMVTFRLTVTAGEMSETQVHAAAIKGLPQ